MAAATLGVGVLAPIYTPMGYIYDVDLPAPNDLRHIREGRFTCPRNGDTGDAKIQLADPDRDLLDPITFRCVYTEGDEITFWATNDPAVAPTKRWGGFISYADYNISNKQLLDIEAKGYGEVFKRDYITKTFYNDLRRDAYDSYDNLNSSVNFGNTHWYAQSFVPTVNSNIIKAKFMMRYNTGTPAQITATLYADVAGNPGGAALSTQTIDSFTTRTFGWYEFVFDPKYPLINGVTYWIVVSSAGSTVTNTYVVAADTNNFYEPGLLKHSTNSGGAWNNPNTETWWSETTVAIGNQQWCIATVVDSNNIIHFIYDDVTVNWIKHTYGRPGNWTTENVYNMGGLVMPYISACIDSNDVIHFSFRAVGDQLWHGYGTVLAGGSGVPWNTELVDNGGGNQVGHYSSICVDKDDVLHIAHYDQTAQRIKYAYGTTGSWNNETIPAAASPNGECSIAVDSKNMIHISFWDGIGGWARYYYGSTGSWTEEMVQAGTNGYTSICVDSNDVPHMVYWDNGVGMKYAYKPHGSGWLTETCDAGMAAINPFTSYDRRIVADSQDVIHMIWNVNTVPSTLRHVYGNYGAWDVNTADNVNSPGNYCALFMKKDVLYIGHEDNTNGFMRYTEFYTRNSRDAIFEVHMEPARYHEVFSTIAQPTMDTYGYTLCSDTFGFIEGILDYRGASLFDALTDVAGKAQARWWVDINKVIHFHTPNNLHNTTDVLTDAVGGNIKDIDRNVRKDLLCNVITVKGKGNEAESISATVDANRAVADVDYNTGTVYERGDQIAYLNMPLGFLPGDAGTTAADLENYTTIKVNDPNHDFSYSGVVKIDDELIAYEGVSGECLYNCIRGANGTIAQKHINGAQVVALEVYTNQMVSVASDNFNDNAIAGTWTQHLSAAAAAAGSTLSEAGKQFVLDVNQNAYGHIQKANTEDLITMICKVRVSDANCGTTWGPGIVFYWGVGNHAHINLWNAGTYQFRFVTDTNGVTTADVSTYTANPNQWYWIKLRANAAGTTFACQYSLDGVNWFSFTGVAGDWTTRPRSATWHAGAPSIIIVGKGWSHPVTYPNADYNNDFAAIGARSISYMDGFTIFKNSVPSANVTFGVRSGGAAGFPAAGTIDINGEKIIYDSIVGNEFVCPSSSVGTAKSTIRGRGNSNGSRISQIRDQDIIVDDQYTMFVPQANSSIDDYGIVKKDVTVYSLDKVEDCARYGSKFINAFDFRNGPLYIYGGATNRILMDADSHEIITTTHGTYGLAADHLEITKLEHILHKKGVVSNFELGQILPDFTYQIGSMATNASNVNTTMPISLGELVNYSDHSDCDENYGLSLDFDIYPGTQEIKQVLLYYSLSRYQAFSTTQSIYWNGGWANTVGGIVNPADWYTAGLLAFGPTNTTKTSLFGTYYVTNSTAAPNKYQVDWRLLDNVTGQVLAPSGGAASFAPTVCNHNANSANADTSCFMLISYENLFNRTLRLEVRDNGAGVGGNNISIFWLANFNTEYEQINFNIVTPTGAWGVTDIKILIDGLDKTADIEADIGRILSHKENETETAIDITKYIGGIGRHRIEIRPDAACRIKGNVIPNVRVNL